MSVRPVQFNADGSIEVVYDEGGHSGTIPADQVSWSTNMDGSHSHNFIVLNCPDGCGASSTHPVGGGAAPVDVQTMFVKKATQTACACGNIEAGNENLADAHMHLQAERMDGPDRWQV